MTIADRREAGQILRAALGAHVDAALGIPGFRRAAGSLTYRRPVEAGHQRVVFDFDLHPRYAKDGIHLLPYIEVVFPSAVEIAGRMQYLGAPEFSLRQPIEPFAPPSRRMIVIRDAAAADEFAGWLATWSAGRLREVLDATASMGGFAETVASGGLPEVTLTTVDWVNVAAVLVAIGDPRRALALLDAHIDLSDPNSAGHVKAVEHLRSVLADPSHPRAGRRAP